MSGIAIAVEAKVDKAQRDLQLLNHTVSNISTEVKKATSSFSLMSKSIVGLGGIALILPTIKSIDATFTNIENKIKTITGATERFNTAFSGVSSIARDTRSTLADTTDSFFRISSAISETSLDMDKVLVATRAIQSGAILAGGNLDGYRAAVMQLGQGLGSGALRGEEFNSVIEQALPIAKAIGDSLGVSVGTLRRMANAGKLTSDLVFNALIMQAGALQKKVSSMDITIEQSMQSLKETLKYVFNSFDKAVNMSGFLSRGIVALSGKLSLLADSAFNMGTDISSVLNSLFASKDLKRIADIATTMLYPFYFAAKQFGKQFMLFLNARGIISFMNKIFVETTSAAMMSITKLGTKLYTLGVILRAIDQQGFLQGKLAVFDAFGYAVKSFFVMFHFYVQRVVNPINQDIYAIGNSIDQTFNVIPGKVIKLFANFTAHISHFIQGFIGLYDTSIGRLFKNLAEAYEDFVADFNNSVFGFSPLSKKLEKYKEILARVVLKSIPEVLIRAAGAIKAALIGFIKPFKSVEERISASSRVLPKVSLSFEEMATGVNKAGKILVTGAENVKDFFMMLVSTDFSKLSSSFSFDGLKKNISNFVKYISNTSLLSSVKSFVKDLLPSDILSKSASVFSNTLQKIIVKIRDVLGSLFSMDKIKGQLTTFLPVIQSGLSSLLSTLTDAASIVYSKVSSFIDSFKQLEMVSAVTDKVEKVFNFIKKKLEGTSLDVDFSAIKDKVKSLFKDSISSDITSSMASSSFKFSDFKHIAVKALDSIVDGFHNIVAVSKKLLFTKPKEALDYILEKLSIVKQKIGEFATSIGIPSIDLSVNLEPIKKAIGVAKEFIGSMVADLSDVFGTNFTNLNLDTSSFSSFKASILKAFDEVSSIFNKNLAVLFAKPMTFHVSAIALGEMFPENKVTEFLSKQLRAVAVRGWKDFIIAWSNTANAGDLSERVGEFASTTIVNAIKNYTYALPQLAGALMSIGSSIFRGFVEGLPIVGKVSEVVFNLAEMLGVAGPLGVIGAFLFGSSILTTLAEIGLLPATLTKVAGAMHTVKSFFMGSYGTRTATGAFTSVLGTMSHEMFNSARRSFSIGAALLGADMLGTFDTMFKDSPIAHSVARGLAVGFMLFGHDVPKLIAEHVLKPIATGLLMGGPAPFSNFLVNYLRGGDQGPLSARVAKTIFEKVDQIRDMFVSRMEGIVTGKGIFESLIYGRTGAITQPQQSSRIFVKYEAMMRSLQGHAGSFAATIRAQVPVLATLMSKWTAFDTALAASGGSGGRLLYALFGKGGLILRIAPTILLITGLLAAFSTFASEAEQIPDYIKGKEGFAAVPRMEVPQPEIVVNKPTIASQVKEWMSAAGDEFKATFPAFAKIMKDLSLLPYKIFNFTSLRSLFAEIGNLFTDIYDASIPYIVALGSIVGKVLLDQFSMIMKLVQSFGSLINAYFTGIVNLGQLVGDTLATYTDVLVAVIGVGLVVFDYFIQRSKNATLALSQFLKVFAKSRFLPIALAIGGVGVVFEKYFIEGVDVAIDRTTVFGQVLSALLTVATLVFKVFKILKPILLALPFIEPLLAKLGPLREGFRKLGETFKTSFTGFRWTDIFTSPLETIKKLGSTAVEGLKGLYTTITTATVSAASSAGARAGGAFSRAIAAALSTNGFLIVAALTGVLVAAAKDIDGRKFSDISGISSFINFFFDLAAGAAVIAIGSFLLLGKSTWDFRNKVLAATAALRAQQGAMFVNEATLAAHAAMMWKTYEAPLLAMPAMIASRMTSLFVFAGSIAAGAFAGAFVTNALMHQSEYTEIGIMIGTYLGFMIGRSLIKYLGTIMVEAFTAAMIGSIAALATAVGYVGMGLAGWFNWSDDFLTQLSSIYDKLKDIAGIVSEKPDTKTGLSKRALDFAKYKGIEIAYNIGNIKESILSENTKKSYKESISKLNESLLKGSENELTGVEVDLHEIQNNVKASSRQVSRATNESMISISKDYDKFATLLTRIGKINPADELFKLSKPEKVNYDDYLNGILMGSENNNVLKDGGIKGRIQKAMETSIEKMSTGGDFSPQLTAKINQLYSSLFDTLNTYYGAIYENNSDKSKTTASAAEGYIVNILSDIERLNVWKGAVDEAASAANKYTTSIANISTNLSKYKIDFKTEDLNVDTSLTDYLDNTYNYLLEIDNQLSKAYDKNNRIRLTQIKDSAIEEAKARVDAAKKVQKDYQYQLSTFTDVGIEIPDVAKFMSPEKAQGIVENFKQLKQLQEDIQKPAVEPVMPEINQLWSMRSKEETARAFEAYVSQLQDYNRIVSAKIMGEAGLDNFRNAISRQIFEGIKGDKAGYAKYIYGIVESIGSPVIDMVDQFGLDTIDGIANQIAELSIKAEMFKRSGDYSKEAPLRQQIEDLKMSIKTLDIQPLQSVIDLLDQGITGRDLLSISDNDLAKLAALGKAIAKYNKDLSEARRTNSPVDTKRIQGQIQDTKKQAKQIADVYRSALPSSFSNIYGRMGLEGKASSVTAGLFMKLANASKNIENLELDRALKSDTLSDWKDFTDQIEKANIELERTKLLGPFVGEALTSAFSDVGVSDFNEMVAYGAGQLTELLGLARKKQSINLDIKAGASESEIQNYINSVRQLAEIADEVAKKRINTITTGTDITQAFSDAGASTNKAALANYQYGASLLALSKKSALLKLDQAKPLTLQAAKENLKALADIDRQLAIYKKIVMNTKENFDSFKSIFDFSVDDTLYARLSNGILGLMGNVAARIDLLMKNASDKDGLSASTRSLYEALALVKRDAKTYSSLLTSVYEAQQSRFDSNKTKYDKISTAFPNLGMDKNLYGTLDRAVRSGFEKSANFSDLFSKISDLGALPVKLADELDRLGNLYASGKNVDIDMIAAAVTQYGEGNLKARLEAIMSSTKDPFTNLKTSTDDLKGAIELLSENVAANTATLRGEAPKAKTSMNMSSNVESLLAASTAKYGVPLDLARIVTHIESRGKNNLTSETGNKGLMQISNDLVKKYNVSNVWDPAQNIDAGVQYLKELLGKFGGDSRKAALGYFEGEGGARKALANPAGYTKGMDYLNKYDARLSGKTPMKFPDATITIPTGAIIDVSGTSNVTANGESVNAGSAATRNVSAFVESRIATANANKIVVNSWRQAIEGIKGTNLGMSLSSAIRKGLSTVGQDTMNASVANTISPKDVLVADEYKQTMTALNDQLNTATDEITKANLQGTLNKVSAEFALFKTRLEDLATAAIKAGQDFSSAVKSTLGDAIKGLMKGETSDVSTLFSTALKKLRDGVIDATIDSMTKGIMNKLPFSFDKIMANAGEAIYKVPGAIWDSMSGKGFGGFTDIWGTLTGGSATGGTPEQVQLQAAKIQLQAAQMQLAGGGGGSGAAASAGIGSWLASNAGWLAGGAGAIGLGSLLYGGKDTKGSWSEGISSLGKSFMSPFGGDTTSSGNPLSSINPVSGKSDSWSSDFLGIGSLFAKQSGTTDAVKGIKDSLMPSGKGWWDSTPAVGEISKSANTSWLDDIFTKMKTGLSDTLGTDGFFGSILKGIVAAWDWFTGLFGSNEPTKAATGGRISGPGTGISDSIPAMLSNGEFVVNAKAAGKHGRLLESINSGNVSKFAEGGFVGGKGLPLVGALMGVAGLFFGGNKSTPKDQSPEQALLAASENLNSAADKLSRGGFGGGNNSIFATGNGLGKGIGGFADSMLGLGGYGSAAGGVLDALFGVKKKENDICSCFTGKGSPATSLFQDIFGLGGDKKPLSGLTDSFGVLQSDANNGSFGVMQSDKNGLMDSFTGMFKDMDFGGMFDVLKEGFMGIFGDLGTSITSLLGGGASGGAGGILESLMSFGSMFAFASGGHVNGPGTSTSDSIPAMLSNGEFIINAKATAATRPLLEAINSGKTPKFALGGSVGDASGNLMTLPSARSGEVINTSRVNNNSNQSVINMNITGDISRQTRSEVFKMIPTIANGVNVHNKEQNYRG
jgi:tape measure domain-containing protein